MALTPGTLELIAAAREVCNGSETICRRCDATVLTYANRCTADLADPCPGFQTIEAALRKIREAFTPQ